MSAASRVAFAVTVLLLPCVGALAEEPPVGVEPGARVRLTLPCEAGRSPGAEAPETVCREEGRVVSVQDQTITLAVAGSSHSYPLVGTTRIEVSRGTRSRWRAGAATGFLVGAGGTFALLNRGDSTNPCDSSANQDAIGMGACLGVAALGGVAGAGVGALIGNLFRTEDWKNVPADRLRVSLGPRPGVGFGVRVAFAF